MRHALLPACTIWQSWARVGRESEYGEAATLRPEQSPERKVRANFVATLRLLNSFILDFKIDCASPNSKEYKLI